MTDLTVSRRLQILFRVLAENILSTPRVFARGCGKAHLAGESRAIAQQRNAVVATRRQPKAKTIATSLLGLTYAGMLAAMDGVSAVHGNAANDTAPLDIASDSRVATPDDMLTALTAQARSGDRDAARALATLHYLGHGTAVDTARALGWWRTAAAAGDSKAAYNAGLLLVRDPAHANTARALLEQAAAAGDVLACFVLGTHLAGRGDHSAALPWLEQAARHGYAPAQYNLAEVLASKTPPDHAGARLWFGAAATTFAPAAAALAALPDASSRPVAPASRQPHDSAWVLAQSPAAFTIQVGAGRDRSALERLLAQGAHDHETALFLHRPAASDPYSAILGVFGARADASAALARLPPALREKAPWIRPFAVLQQDIIALEHAADAAPPEP